MIKVVLLATSFIHSHENSTTRSAGDGLLTDTTDLLCLLHYLTTYRLTIHSL